MNILTKICVVVLLVTSLVACVVFVNMATNVPNYRYFYEQEQLRTEQSMAKVRNQMDDLAKSRRALDVDRKKFIEEEADLRSKNGELQASLTEAKRKSAELNQKLTGLQASLDGLSRSQEAHVKTNDGLL